MTDWHQAIIASEHACRALESYTPEARQKELTMACDLASWTFSDVQGHLKPITHSEDWQRYLKARTLIEAAYGLTDPMLLNTLVTDIQTKAQTLKGQWYLFEIQGQVVGAIGLIPFEHQGVIWGRLKDVDILPAFQNRGYGNQLLNAIKNQAKALNCHTLGLMALADDWPHHWYQRQGFQIVGNITH